MNDVVILQSGPATARLVPAAGGRVSMLQLAPDGGGAAVDVLHPYPEDFFDPLRWAKGGIYPLMPYSNRIAGGRLQVGGDVVTLAPHPDVAPHTLHGNAHALPWQLESQGVDHAVMVLQAPAGPAWRWAYRGRMELRLTASTLSVALSMRNDADSLMPAGLGLHPYFRHIPAGEVAYRVSTVWPSNADFIAESSRPATAQDIHMPARPLRAGGLTDYLGSWDGHATVVLPEGAQLDIQADPLFSHLVVHRPDNLAYLCLEPVSHVADGFNLAARGVTDTGTRWLAPGESLRGGMVFSLRKAAP